jgi:hypothetical protein
LERRLYFVFGDLLACAATGAVAGWAAHAVVPGGWYALAGMALGMFIGFLVGLFGGVLFTPFFGSLEIALPAGLAGMVAGSVVGMFGGMAGIDAAAALWIGALAGLACLAFTYILQAGMQGEVA